MPSFTDPIQSGRDTLNRGISQVTSLLGAKSLGGLSRYNYPTDNDTNAGAFLRNIDNIRSIEWGKVHNWDIAWADGYAPPAPFDCWFPASSVEYSVGNAASYDIQAPAVTLQFPQRTETHTVRVTCFDDANRTLQEWFRKWYSEMFPDKFTVQLLDKVWRPLRIALLDQNRRYIREDCWKVYPETDVNFSGQSESGPVVHDITFRIVGKMGK